MKESQKHAFHAKNRTIACKYIIGIIIDYLEAVHPPVQILSDNYILIFFFYLVCI